MPTKSAGITRLKASAIAMAMSGGSIETQPYRLPPSAELRDSALPLSTMLSSSTGAAPGVPIASTESVAEGTASWPKAGAIIPQSAAMTARSERVSFMV